MNREFGKYKGGTFFC